MKRWSWLVVLAASLPFLPALRAEFLNWDDNFLIINNPHIRGFGWYSVRWMFTATLGGPYQPAAWLSYALDHALWGLNPVGFHLTNILLHVLNAFLFMALARRLLEHAYPTAGPGKLATAAAFAAALFAAHPLRVEVVVWAAERRELLCAAFYLAAVLFYLDADAAPAPRRRRALLALCLAAFCLALLAKAIAVTLPVALLILDWWRRRRPDYRVLVPFFALSALLGFFAQGSQVAERSSWSLAQHGMMARAAQAACGFWFYLKLTAWPRGLSPIYELERHLDPWQWRYALSMIALSALTAAAVLARKRRPAWVAGLAFYGATLAPVSGILQAGPQFGADRYTYLACLPLPLLAAGAWLRLSSKGKQALSAGCAAALGVVLVMAALSWRQAGYWTDNLTLWSRAVSASPGSALAHANLGGVLAQLSRQNDAVPHLEEALRLDPDCIASQDELARALRLGKRPGDLPGLLQAINEHPICRKARLNLMTARAAMGEISRPQAYFRDILLIEGDNPQARANLDRLEGQDQ